MGSSVGFDFFLAVLRFVSSIRIPVSLTLERSLPLRMSVDSFYDIYFFEQNTS